MSLRVLAAVALVALAGCASTTADDASASDDALTGGTRDAQVSASGYLVDTAAPTKVHCGATVIAPRVVVTAAHCVSGALGYAFGTGDTGSAALNPVESIVIHPSFHAEAQGMFDLVHALRNYDVAYLYLKNDAGVKPAALSPQKPAVGCNVQAIAYATENGKAVRKSTAACLLFDVTLGEDPIFELHPADSSALCVADGDDGSGVMIRNGDSETLVGIFAGSVTAGLTDCKRGTQYLDGYESMFGYSEFLRAGIASR